MLRVTFALVLATGGCGRIEPEQDGPSGAVVDTRFYETSSPAVFVLVVDDAPGGDAVTLRARIGQAFRTTGEAWALASTPCDPAGWSAAEWRVFIVHSSAPPATRIVGPPDIGALALSSPRFTIGDADALANGVSAALAGFVADPAATYRPLEAETDAVSLLLGLRPPTDAHERALFASAGAANQIRVVVASTRDDASPLPPPEYTHVPGADVVILLPLVSGVTCAGESDAPRLASWGARPLGDPGFPCDDTALIAHALFPQPPVRSCRPRVLEELCQSHRVATRSDGTAECILVARVTSQASCDQGRGWLDPKDVDGVRRPRFELVAEGMRRLCEVRQLSGSEGVACRETLECAGCASGFCLTEVESLVGSCHDRRQAPITPRFVGSSVSGSMASFELVCTLSTN